MQMPQQQRPQVPGGLGGQQQPQYPGQGVINSGQGPQGPGSNILQGTLQPGQGLPPAQQQDNKSQLSKLLERPPINQPNIRQPGPILNRPPMNPQQQQSMMQQQQQQQGVMNPMGGGMVR